MVVVAVIQGRGGPDQQPCDQAEQYMTTISRLSQSGRLSTVEAAQLHNAATQLSAIARTSFSDDTRAIKDAARAAAGAQAGQRFDAVKVLDEFGAACPSGGLALTPATEQHPQRDSNPCYRRERATS